jgi:hypothetical protein
MGVTSCQNTPTDFISSQQWVEANITYYPAQVLEISKVDMLAIFIAHGFLYVSISYL